MKFNHQNHPFMGVDSPIHSQTRRNTLIFPEKRINSDFNALKMKRLYFRPTPPSFYQNCDSQFQRQDTRGVLLQPQPQFRQFNQRSSQSFEHSTYLKPLQGSYFIFELELITAIIFKYRHFVDYIKFVNQFFFTLFSNLTNKI